MDFAKAIEDAQRLPETPDDVENSAPDPFKGMDPITLVSRVMSGDSGQIPNAAEYNYKYHCTRLLIGQIMRGYENGMPIYEDIDEGAELREIMNKSLQAKAIIFKKETTFLKDGSVAIWLEWGEPEMAPKIKGPQVLSLTELMSPESSNLKSENPEDTATREDTD